MTSREQFEKWYTKECGFCNVWVARLRSYECQIQDAAWKAWKASRAQAIEEVSIHYFRLGNVALATDIQRLKDKK